MAISEARDRDGIRPEAIAYAWRDEGHDLSGADAGAFQLVPETHPHPSSYTEH